MPPPVIPPRLSRYTCTPWGGPWWPRQISRGTAPARAGDTSEGRAASGSIHHAMSVDLPSPLGVVSSVSAHSLDGTLAKLRQAITQKGLTLICEVDHSAAARSVGLEMQPAHVLIFGNPAAGTAL